MRMQDWSLPSLKRSRIQHCHELWCRPQTRLRSNVAVVVVQASSCSSNSTPSQGTFICHRWDLKKRRRRKTWVSFLGLSSCMAALGLPYCLGTHCTLKPALAQYILNTFVWLWVTQNFPQTLILYEFEPLWCFLKESIKIILLLEEIIIDVLQALKWFLVL